jgi:hypothetical protein
METDTDASSLCPMDARNEKSPSKGKLVSQSGSAAQRSCDGGKIH